MDLARATKYAQELFGESAGTIMMHRSRVREAWRKAQAGAEEAKAAAIEHDKRTRAQQEEHVGKLKQAYSTGIDEIRTKFPEWFSPDESDPEGNKLLTDGERLADIAFLGDPNLGPEQVVRVQSDVRNRAAAFGRMVHRNNKLQARVAELEKELEDYKAGQPGTGKPAGETPAQDTSWEQALDKM
jgi:hypothetical protein